LEYDMIQLSATCLFADIRDSSGLTNALGNDFAAKTIKAFFAAIVPVIEEKGGVVGDFNGDGALVLFSGEGRARRAISVAMEIQRIAGHMIASRVEEHLKRFDIAEHGPGGIEFSVSIGVDDGDLYAVRVGTSENSGVSWVGQSSNTSAKLSRQSPPGSIAVTREVSEGLSDDTDGDGTHGATWLPEVPMEIGGAKRFVRRAIVA
jgi:class 3 adenylate cyclase